MNKCVSVLLTVKLLISLVYVNVAHAQRSASGSLMRVANVAPFLNEGTVSSILVDGNSLYVVMSTYGLYVFDISNPLKPLQKGQPISLDVPTNGLIKVGRYLYISDNSKGVVIVDVSSPYQAKLVESFKTKSGQCWDLQVDSQNKYLFVAAGSGGVESWFIQNRLRPKNIFQTKDRIPAHAVRSLAFHKNRLYISDKDAGLLVLSAKEPEGLVLISSYRSVNSDAIVNDVWSDGNHIYLSVGSAGIEIMKEDRGVLELYPVYKQNVGDYASVIVPYDRSNRYVILGSGTKGGLRIYNSAKVEGESLENQVKVGADITSIAQRDHILYVGTVGLGVVTFTYNIIPRLKAKLKNQTVYEGEILEYLTPEILDLDDDYYETSIRLADGSKLPKGVSYSDETGYFDWKTNMQQEGVYKFVLRVQEEGVGALVLEYPFSVNVLHTVLPPVFPKFKKTAYNVNENESLVIQIPEAKMEEKDRKMFVYGVTNLPKGGSFDKESRRFRWKPGFDDAGNQDLFFYVSYPKENVGDTIKVNIRVNNMNRPPSFTKLEDSYQLKENDKFSLDLSATDPDKEDAQSLKIRVRRLPKGATFDKSKNRVIWTPNFDQASSYKLDFVVSDLGYNKFLKKGANVLSTKRSVTFNVAQTNRKPAFVSMKPKKVKESKKISFKVAAKDPDKEDVKALDISAMDLPPGAIYSKLTQRFEWTPKYNQSGSYDIRFQVKDKGIDGKEPLTDVGVVSIDVQNVNLAPKIERLKPETVQENKKLNINIVALDPDIEDTGKLVMTASGLPEGSKFDDEKQVLTWNPTFDQAGKYKVTFKVKDVEGLTGSAVQQITVLNVNRAPKISSISPKKGVENSNLSFKVIASDEDKEDRSLKYVAGLLPDNAKFSKQVFSWKPTFEQAGDYKIMFIVEDKGIAGNLKPNVLKVLRDSIVVDVKIEQKNRPPFFVKLPRKVKVKENGEIKFNVVASDKDTEDDGKLKITATNLPKGAVFSNDKGSFSWKPMFSQYGSYNITFKVVDSGIGGSPLETEQVVQINVENVNRSPKFVDLPEVVKGKENELMTVKVKVSDEDKEDVGKLKVTASKLPSGASYDKATGEIKWTPSYVQAGNYTVHLVVSDQGLDKNLKPNRRSVAKEKKSIKLEIAQTNRPPKLAAIPDKEVVEKKKLAFSLKGSDDDKEDKRNLRYKVSNLPNGAEFNEKRLQFTWVPTYQQSGSYEVSFTVTDQGIDGKALSDTKKAKIVVIHQNRKPEISDLKPTTVKEGKSLEVTLKVSDPDKEDEGKLKVYAKGDLPSGMALKEGNVISWLPTYAQSGNYTAVFEVSDGGDLKSSKQMKVKVLNVNRPPSLSKVESPVVQERDIMKFELEGTDPDKEDKLVYSAEGLPKGSRLKGKTFTWRPTYAQAGVYNVKFKVSDLGLDGNLKKNKKTSLSSEQEVELVVKQKNRAPKFKAVKQKFVKEGGSLSFDVVATDPDREEASSLTITPVSLPKGASYETGKVKWIPTYEQGGTYEIGLKVEDTGLGSEKLSNELKVKVSVLNVNRSPKFVDLPEVVKGKENEPMTVKVKVSDEDKEDVGKLKVTASKLPSGASYDKATGEIKWTPSYVQAGNYTVHLVVSDQGLDKNLKPNRRSVAKEKKSIKLEIAQTNRPPKLAAIPDKEVIEKKKLAFSLKGSDDDKEDKRKLKYKVSNLPDGAKFNEKRLQFTWVPTYQQSGSYEVSFTVTDQGIDGKALSDTKKAKIVVIHQNRKPEISDLKPTTVKEGKSLEVTLKVSDPDKEDEGKLKVYAKGDLPSGMALKEGNVISWLPTYAQSGNYTAVFEVSDGGGLKSSKQMKVKVLNVNRPPSLSKVESPVVQERDIMKFELEGTDPDKEDKLVYSAEGLPKGSRLKGKTFTWRPTYAQAGVYNVKFKVSDLGLDGNLKKNKKTSLSSEQEVELVVKQKNRAPKFKAVKQKFVKEGGSLSFDVVATDPDREEASSLTITPVSLPKGASYETGKVKWIPTYEQGGTYEIGLKVEDTGLGSEKLSNELKVKVSVLNVNRSPKFVDLPEVVKGKENEPMTVKVKVSDEDKEDVGKLKVTASKLPSGASYDKATGEIKWTPSYVQAGNYTVHLVVSDQGLDKNLKPNRRSVAKEKKSIKLEIAQTNRPPKLAAIPDKEVIEKKKLAFSLKGSDDDKEDKRKLKYKVSNLPDGAKFNEKRLQFTWVPTYQQSGSYEVSFTVTDQGIDGKALSDTKKAKIVVIHQNRKPEISDLKPTTVKEGKSLEVTLKVSDPDKEDEGKLKVYAKGDLPSGMALKEGNVISWLPTYAQSGNYTAVFEVSDGGDLKSSKQMKVKVLNVNRPPSLSKVESPVVQERDIMKFELEGTDPDKEDKLVYSAEGLPKGSRLKGKTFTWRPTYAQAGVYNVKFKVSDLGLDGNLKKNKKTSLSSEQEVELVVKQKNRAPKFKAVKQKFVKEGGSLSFDVVATDPDREEASSLTITPVSLPKGASYETGKVKWIPTYEQGGTYEIGLKVEDTGLGSEKLSNELKVKVSVLNVNRSPKFVDLPEVVKGKENEPMTVKVKVSDEDKEDVGKLKVTASKLPSGASYDKATGEIKWTPSYVQAGNYTVHLVVSDQGLDKNLKPNRRSVAKEKKSIKLEIAQTNRPPKLAAIPDKEVVETKKIVFKVKASDPDKEDRSKLQVGVSGMPVGATFKRNRFSWIPKKGQKGEYEVEFNVKDIGARGGSPITVKQLVKIKVLRMPLAPTIKQIPTKVVKIGSSLILKIEANGEPEDKISIVLNSMPKGSEFDDASNEFRWTPGKGQQGKYTVSIVAKNNSERVVGSKKSLTTVRRFKINVVK